MTPKTLPTVKVLFLVAALLPTLATAQEMNKYNRAISAFNAGELDSSAELFYELTEHGADADIRNKSEYYLAQSLQKKGFLVSAYVYYALILKAGKAHPFYLKAVEGLVNIQQALDDEHLIPNLLDKEYNDSWAQLSTEVAAKINFMIGGISLRRGKFEQAKVFLESVPKTSPSYAKAQYLLGVVLADPRYPGGHKNREAIERFLEVLDLPSTGAVEGDLENVRQLALLALGRTYYGDQQYSNASKAYERVPRFSRYWDQALFENGFSRFQNDDLGGSLGSLQALHAPQFANAFQPESWILKGTVYYFSCLYDEANAALKVFDSLYDPMLKALKPWVEKPQDITAFYKAVEDPNSDRLPRPVLIWVRGNERLLGVFRFLNQLDREKTQLRENQSWRASKLAADIGTTLDQNRATMVQVGGQLAKNRITEAYQNLKTFGDQGEIIRFETSKAEKELAEAGVDQRQLLSRQRLYRPAMPAEDWNYWKFQGEFWIDEIGYYQYTLKRGCPAVTEE